MSEKALGNKQKAVLYLEDAIKINPRYSFAKDRLSALKGMSEKKVREAA